MQRHRWRLGWLAMLAAWAVMADPADDADLALEPVVVSASRIPVSGVRTTAATTAITREEIETTNPASAVDLMRHVPGLHIDQPGGRGGVSSIYLRNSDPNFTAVLIDGVKVNDPTNSRGGSFDLSTLSVESIERVEVVRGPLSAVHGGDALAGVINIITHGETDEPRLTVAPEVGTEGLHRLHAGFTGRAGEAYVALGGSRINDDRVSGSGFRANHLTAKVDIAPTPASAVQVTTRFVDAESETFPDDSGGPELAEIRDVDRRDAREFSLGVDTYHEVSEVLAYQLLTTLFVRREDFSSPGVAPGARDPFGIPARTTDSRFQRVGFEVGALLAPTQMLELAAGVDLEHEGGESESVVTLGGASVPGAFDLSRAVLGAYLEGRAETPFGVSVNAGVRLDSPEDFDREVSARAGISYRIGESDTTLKASWARGFKLPSFFALGNPIVGNPDLTPETSDTVDLSVRQAFRGGSLVADVTYFQSRFFDLVDLDEGPPPALVNRSEVSIEGVELGVRGRVTPAISANAHLTYAESDIEGTQEPLRNRPEWRGGAGVAWALRSDLTARVTGLYVGPVPDSSVPTGDVTLDAYVRFDARLSYRPDPALTVTLAVDNLFDEAYEEAVGFPAPGITPRLGVRAVF